MSQVMLDKSVLTTVLILNYTDTRQVFDQNLTDQYILSPLFLLKNAPELLQY